MPPSSSTSGLPAAASATLRPVAVDPMNPIACVPGLRAISSPTTGPGPGHEVEDARRADRPRPRTRPARSPRPTCSGAGVQTTALPQASAGRDQLGGHRVRPVPRGDHADHAERAADEQHALARRDRIRQPALRAGSRPRPRSASRRSAPRPRRTPPRAAACPGRASAFARATSRRRSITSATRSSPPHARTPSGAPTPERPRWPPRSRAARPRGRPAEPRRSPRRSRATLRSPSRPNSAPAHAPSTNIASALVTELGPAPVDVRLQLRLDARPRAPAPRTPRASCARRRPRGLAASLPPSRDQRS